MSNNENEILEGDDLLEFQSSFGVDASVPEPVATKDNSRPADKNGWQRSNANSKQVGHYRRYRQSSIRYAS